MSDSTIKISLDNGAGNAAPSIMVDGVRYYWRSIVAGSIAIGIAGYAGAWFIPPTYTARTVVMPPQQQQSSVAAALGSSLGALAGLVGGVSLKSTADQYVALMQSATVSDRIIDKFNLLKVYDEEYRVDARLELSKNVVIAVGKKDGLLIIDVDDKSPQRAADMANAYVEELRNMTNTLAVSEAQQRRKFFEQRLEQTKSKLVEAQTLLQASGFNAGVLRAEPKAAADGYAKLRAELMSAEVKMQTLKRVLADTTPEVQQQQAVVATLRSELAKLEQRNSENTEDSNYISKYRDYKYQEALFDVYAKQFELARLDESREGVLIQVVDNATPPEKKSKPKKIAIALISGALAGLIFYIRAILKIISVSKVN